MYCIKRNHLIIIAMYLLSIVPLNVHAQLIVNGQTISWTVNGWYQVQREDTFESVCESSESCTVEPGTYIVINHTNGQRFRPIIVTADTVLEPPATDSIMVQGNVISWPDDGWYQVQRSEDYVTVCEAGRSCVVPPGTYTVINHSLDIKHTDIVVGEVDTAQDDAVMIQNGLIEWSGAGWYQVQRESSFETICEGHINACKTGTGFFQLINHTTDRRWDDLEVHDNTDTLSYVTDTNAETILEYIVGIINEEQLQPYSMLVSELTQYDHSDTTQSTDDGFELLGSVYLPENSSPEYLRHDYRCIANEGNMSIGRSLSLQQYVGDIVFSQCQNTLANNDVVEGEVEYDWTLIKNVFNLGSQRSVRFEGLVLAKNSTSRTLNANLNVTSGSLNTRIWSANVSDSVDPDFVARAPEGDTMITLTEIVRSSGTSKESDAAPWSRRLRANFTVQAPEIDNVALTVTTENEFVTLNHNACFDSGVLTATATDGSWLRINANNDDTQSFDLTVYSNAETITRTVRWSQNTILKQLAGEQVTAPEGVQSACAERYIDIF